MKNINYGILGCGMMGQEHIRNLALIDGCTIAGLYDSDEAMLAASKKLAPDAKIASSTQALICDESLDCLVIVTPNFLHADNLREITNLRTIPILVEKPLVIRKEDKLLIEELQHSYKAPIWVAMEYRYMPPLKLFLEKLEEATGGVRHLSIREHRFPFLEKVGDWNRFNRYSGGTLVEKCCHFFDLMRLITKSEPNKVLGSGWQAVNHIEERYHNEQPDIWDAAFVTVEFTNQCRAMLDLCMFAEGAQYQEEIVAVGPNGRIECLIPGPARFWPTDAGPQPKPKVIISERGRGKRTEITVDVDETLQTVGDHQGSTYFQHLKFKDVVLGSQLPEVTLEDGWKAVEMGLAAQESSQTGNAVVI